MDCIFCKIKDRKIAKDFLYEDEDVMAFYDIHPIRLVHILIVPKKHVEDIADLDDEKVWSKIKNVAINLAKKEGLDDKGFRISINGGGAQIIRHMHVHLMGPISKTTKL